MLQNPHFDQAVDTVFHKQVGEIDSVLVAFTNHARGVLPIHARLTFSDGSKQDITYPAEVWSTNTAVYVRIFGFAGKKLTKVEIDPEQRTIDIDRGNNVWPRAAATPPPTKP